MQAKEQVITMNQLISSVLLFYPNEKEVSFGSVKEITNTLYHYVREKNYHTYVGIPP